MTINQDVQQSHVAIKDQMNSPTQVCSALPTITEGTKPFLFMKLPLELRRMVYKRAFDFHCKTPESHRWNRTSKFRPHVVQDHTIMALLWTSWQIHHKMVAVLSEIPRIYIDLYEKAHCVCPRQVVPIRGSTW